ncbi:MAG: DUF3667 domain-containing protein, partial [Cyclobacteriaceae bacterium]|nr:DUF3667 domain-containing protein [Cyclobacteriaceae bacterium]
MNKKAVNSKPDRCQNCYHPLDEKMEYCPSCGQKAMPEHLTFKYFIHEFLNNYFSFDSKFFNTLKPLITKPAFLSLEFIEGRRIRYINPIQLFVFISFLYFLADSFMFLKEDPESKNYVVMTTNGEEVNLDSLDMKLFKADTLDALKDTIQDDGKIKTFIKDFVIRLKNFNQLDKDEQNERVSEMISYFIFILTPLFALLLGWFFKKRNRHYLENLIFSLHFHAFFFLTGIFFMVFDRIILEPID